MASLPSLRYVECPRDAWQALPRTIPTGEKQAFLGALLEAGFRHLDLGSFVSARAVPQLADTEEVLAGLVRPEDGDFLCIVANEQGVERALATPQVSSIGYPLSVTPTFQQRNTGRSLEASWGLVEELAAVSRERGVGLVVYLSMAFGNPHGDPWEPARSAAALERLRDLGVDRIALADTIGSATPALLREVLAAVRVGGDLGLHLHARPGTWREQLEIALGFGLRWFEGALAGVGGCPFAADRLVGNLPTEQVLPWLAGRGFSLDLDLGRLQELGQQAALLAARYSG